MARFEVPLVNWQPMNNLNISRDSDYSVCWDIDLTDFYSELANPAKPVYAIIDRVTEVLQNRTEKTVGGDLLRMESFLKAALTTFNTRRPTGEDVEKYLVSSTKLLDSVFEMDTAWKTLGRMGQVNAADAAIEYPLTSAMNLQVQKDLSITYHRIGEKKILQK
jgi:hypothetical protein